MAEADLYNWVILPLLIFFARISDVSIGTIRIVLLSKDKKFFVTILAFLEITIWLLAVRQIFLNLSNPVCYLAFAGGFATGNYVGLIIEEKIAVGFVVIRAIVRDDPHGLIACLNKQGYGVTSIAAKGSTGDVSIVFTVIKRAHIPHVKEIIKKYNPNAFYTIEDLRAISESGFFIKNKHKEQSII